MSAGLRMNGRTYCGHYKGHYLKSTLEYIYPKYLNHMDIAWDYELKTFQLSNGGSYKPDFFLIDSQEYVEVKGGFNFKIDLPRIQQFEADLGVKVKILQERDLRELIKTTPFVFERLRREWKAQAGAFGMDTSGRNNPRYGVQFSEETKAKIAAKAKARMQDPVYKEKWLTANLAHTKSPDNIERLRQLNQRFHLVTLTCSLCHKPFSVQPNKAKKRLYCSHLCSANGQFSKYAHGEDIEIQKVALEFAQTNAKSILTAKFNKIKPTLASFYERVYQISGIQDERTLSKVLLGRVGNRKEILYYFRSLVENVLGANVNQETLELEDKEPLG